MSSKLIGTKPNQVPSNADLGSAAYMDVKDFLLSRGSELSAINNRLDEPVVDVFIYDTSKDSDGGAWRKRVSHTTWYNEELNTPVRGSRKEFPSVALITAESYNITIYDADDPTLPMWMRIMRGTDTEPTMLWDGNNGNTGTSVRGLNGLIAWTTSAAGTYGADFIGERWLYLYNNATNSGYREDGGGIVNRHVACSSRSVIQQFDGYTNNGNHNNIAMKVFKDAPIDPVTGIQIPTIALGTAGGATVVNDNPERTVSNKSATVGTNYTRVYKLEFMDDDTLVYYHDRGYNQRNCIAGFKPSTFTNDYSAFDHNGDNRFTFTPSSTPGPATLGSRNNSLNPHFYNIATSGSRIAGGKAIGLNLFDLNTDVNPIEPNLSIPSRQPMGAYITTDYNTGWMPGNTLTALLCDCRPEVITGVELAPTGSVTSITGEQNDFSAWTAWNTAQVGSTSAQALDGSNSLSINCQGNADGAYFSAYCEAGVTYVISWAVWQVSGSGGNFQLEVGDAIDGSEYVDYVFPSVYDQWQTLNYSFTPTTSETLYFLFRESGSGAPDCYLDNVSLTVAELDRSSWGNENKLGNMHVYGSIVKSEVAPGAELCGYGGFSTADILKQPFQANLSFTTTGYCITGWFRMNSTSSTGMAAQIGPGDTSESLCVYMNSSYGIYFDYGSGTQYCSLATAADRSRVMDGKWHQFVCAVEPGEYPRIFLDGIERPLTNGSLGTPPVAPSPLMSGDVGVNWYLNIGNGRGVDNSIPFDGELSLIKIMDDIPSDEIIKKIYEDERRLFRANAKATLYGSSDFVYASTYDRETGYLHAGTNQGRSVFDGLVRVDNTTNPVTVAISAVDGFVAEE